MRHFANRASIARARADSIVGADPEGSIYSGDTPKSYKVEGIGMSYLPQTVNMRATRSCASRTKRAFSWRGASRARKARSWADRPGPRWLRPPVSAQPRRATQHPRCRAKFGIGVASRRSHMCLETGRVVLTGAAAELRERDDIQYFYLGSGADDPGVRPKRARPVVGHSV
jgi:hypothetical protein